jgi:hypothetical protein
VYQTLSNNREVINSRTIYQKRKNQSSNSDWRKSDKSKMNLIRILQKDIRWRCERMNDRPLRHKLIGGERRGFESTSRTIRLVRLLSERGKTESWLWLRKSFFNEGSLPISKGICESLLWSSLSSFRLVRYEILGERRVNSLLLRSNSRSSISE